MSLQRNKIKYERTRRRIGRIKIEFMKQCFRDPSITLSYTNTAYMLADVHTKMRLTGAHYMQLCYLAGEGDPHDMPSKADMVLPPEELPEEWQEKIRVRTRKQPPKPP